MKNENLNLINVLLVVAIVLAVGGTWLNLNKLSEVNKVTLAGYAIAAGAGGSTLVDTGVDVGGLVGVTGAPGGVYATGEGFQIDCYISTWNQTTGLLDTTPCALASSGNLSNITMEVQTNVNYNFSAYFT
ncbi:hypothetical protein KY312_01060, partial [Candidatus Woesearchaeota archaeon]|nr:hypothetical protein [Candidatus Woesearchaeota archaeon]